jgi:GNAT superfamily N-acetyltransferase
LNTVLFSEGHLDLVQNFSCGKEGLDNFLKEQAIDDQKEHKSTTTLVIRRYRDKITLIGFYTLKNTSLLFKPDNKLRGYPAIEIVYFAVDKRFQRKGLGSKILKTIIFRAIELSKNFSAVAALVLSSENDVVDFYKKNRFKDFSVFFDLLYDDCREETTSLFLNLVVE